MSGDPRAPTPVWVRACQGGLLLLAAVGLYQTKGFGAPDRSRPLVLALPADGRWIESTPFRASIGGDYRASLTLERKYPHREMECLADVGMPLPTSTESGRRSDCPTGFTPAQLQWSLIEEGRPARQTYDFGQHAGEYGSDTLGRSLGIFELRPGRSYVVRARLSGAPPQLWTTGPKLELAFGDMASLIVQALLFSAASGAMGLIGLGYLIAAAWKALRNPSNPHSTA